MSEWVEDCLVAPDPANDEPSWWAHYRERVKGSLSDTALEVLDADCRYILEKGVLGAGPAGSPQWGVHRVRSGLVMGSVQSGKTASMMGVAAMALDSEIDIVIVLAGTRLTLWRQTFDRLRSQLDVERQARDDGERRILLPSPSTLSSSAAYAPRDLYRILSKPGARVAAGKVPLIAVVMKNGQHLQAQAEWIRSMASKNHVQRPVHMLVIDDEADDGSILDSGSGAHKQIPYSVEQLWKPGLMTGESNFWDHLHVTYLAYTATPQANLLQAEVNPLSPRDFVCALRVPGRTGTLSPREAEYAEPRGRARQYTGGDTFYRRHRDLLVSVVPPASDPLPEALRAFFVAGAHKILDDATRETPSIARTKSYASRERAASYGPRPHTMLVHPSAKVIDHFDMAAQILAWTHGIEREEADRLLDEGERRVGTHSLAQRLANEEAEWRHWHDSYIAARQTLAASEGADAPDPLPWAEVRQTLIDEVFPWTDIAVINSDENADERPSYGPERTPTSRWRTGRNLSTIFVSGNVMARGLTLEGLTTSLFNRTTPNPLADTQMQMQRWFGYRGADLHLVRLFIDQAQLDLFAEYHLADTALRRQILAEMNTGNAAPDPTVFQGASFRATGKIANLKTLPVHPGRAPFFGATNGADDPNNRLVADLFSTDAERVSVGGVTRGLLLREPVPATEVADILDRYEYRWRDAESEAAMEAVWANAAHLVDVPAPQPPLRLLRQQPVGPHARTSLGLITPSSVAAYLRLWEAVHKYPSHGLLPMGSRSASSIATPRFAPAPEFRIGLRYGGLDPCADGVWSGSGVHPRLSERDLQGDRLTGSWGSRRPDAPPGAYSSDEHFDYHARDEMPPAWDGSRSGWRPAGAPGLLLFQLVEVEQGAMPAVAMGLAIPLGGPNQFPAYVGGGPAA